MSRMANWTDGPEYAPADRPDAFQAPAVEPLQAPAAPPDLAAGAPIAQPWWQPPQAAVVPLEALVPAAGLPPRDPRLEFTTVSTKLTTGSVWGPAQSERSPGAPVWTPDQPLGNSSVLAGTRDPATAPPFPAGPPAAALNFPPPQQAAPSFPQPGTPDWFAPPPQTRWQPPNQTVSVAQMWRAATPGVMITLIVGALLSPLSVAMVALSGLLASRVQYRVGQVRRSYLWVGGLLAVIATFSLLSNDFDLSTAWGVVAGWAQLACWILPVVVMLQVGAGIRANEPPQRPW